MEESQTDILRVLESLLKPINDQLAELKAENAELKSKIRMNMETASEGAALPGHLAAPSISSLTDSRFARHAVVATRPVIDSPDDPMWKNEGIADPGMLVRNSLSGGMSGGE